MQLWLPFDMPYEASFTVLYFDKSMFVLQYHAMRIEQKRHDGFDVSTAVCYTEAIPATAQLVPSGIASLFRTSQPFRQRR